MSEWVLVAVIVMGGLLAMVFLWQILEIGKQHSIREAPGSDQLQKEVESLAERVSRLEQELASKRS